MPNKLPKLLAWLVLACQPAVTVPAFTQQNQPIGTANTIGSVSNANSTIGSSSTGTVSSSTTSRSSPGILLPSGRRGTTSNSTVVVCDDPGAPFPDQLDVCSLRLAARELGKESRSR